jgi:hypothetical protein
MNVELSNEALAFQVAKVSAPMIGFCTSATMKIQRNVRREPRLTVRERVPNVAIYVLLTAQRVKSY